MFAVFCREPAIPPIASYLHRPGMDLHAMLYPSRDIAERVAHQRATNDPRKEFVVVQIVTSYKAQVDVMRTDFNNRKDDAK